MFAGTPNPSSKKFQLSKNLTQESMQFSSREKALSSPLASRLFAAFPADAVKSVLIGNNFVTVRLQSADQWTNDAVNAVTSSISQWNQEALPVLQKSSVWLAFCLPLPSLLHRLFFLRLQNPRNHLPPPHHPHLHLMLVVQ